MVAFIVVFVVVSVVFFEVVFVVTVVVVVICIPRESGGEVPKEEASRDDQHGEDLPGLEVLVEPGPEVVVDGGDEQVDLEELGGQADGQEGSEERCQEDLERKN